MGKKEAVVGVIGFGTVGSGTVKVLMNNADIISARLGFPVRLKHVADLDTTTDRGIGLPEGMLVDDASRILGDPEIDIVVELIGGYNPAGRFMRAAIEAGKHVVTANKALLATQGAELFALAAKKGVGLGFEASVAGGVPIIKVIREALAANNILSIYGIINGTSNYILTRMTDEGLPFEDVLREAQGLGYAEADPTFDIEGHDAAHKLTLLASLAYGIPLSFDRLHREGISGIAPVDIEFAKELGYKIKLLAIAKLAGGRLELRVHPTMIPGERMIAKVDGVFNAVYVKGDAVGETLYYGRGAGDMPTASAVVADIMEAARCVVEGRRPTALEISDKPIEIRPMADLESMYYFRFMVLDKPGVLSKIAGVFGRHDISIASVIQKGHSSGGSVQLVIQTHAAREGNVIEALAGIEALDVVTAKPAFIRVEGD